MLHRAVSAVVYPGMRMRQYGIVVEEVDETSISRYRNLSWQSCALASQYSHYKYIFTVCQPLR